MFSRQQTLGQQPHSASAVHVGCNETSRRLEIGQQRRALAYSLEVINLQGDTHFACDRQQMGGIVARIDAKGIAQSDHQIGRTMTELMAKAVADIQAGKFVIVADDEDRLHLREYSLRGARARRDRRRRARLRAPCHAAVP